MWHFRKASAWDWSLLLNRFLLSGPVLNIHQRISKVTQVESVSMSEISPQWNIRTELGDNHKLSLCQNSYCCLAECRIERKQSRRKPAGINNKQRQSERVLPRWQSLSCYTNQSKHDGSPAGTSQQCFLCYHRRVAGAVRVHDELRSDVGQRACCMLVILTSDCSCQQVNNFHSTHAYRGGCGRLALCVNGISLHTSLWLSNIMILHPVQHSVYILRVSSLHCSCLSRGWPHSQRVDLKTCNIFAFMWTSTPHKSMSAGHNSREGSRREKFKRPEMTSSLISKPLTACCCLPAGMDTELRDERQIWSSGCDWTECCSQAVSQYYWSINWFDLKVTIQVYSIPSALMVV